MCERDRIYQRAGAMAENRMRAIQRELSRLHAEWHRLKAFVDLDALRITAELERLQRRSKVVNADADTCNV